MPQANFQPTWALIKQPAGYPTGPAPGKLELIWSTNSKSLYHRLSPYTDYDATLLSKVFSDTEPFYYVYADQNKQGLNALKKYESRVFPAGSAPIDVIRVSKFLVSGRGIPFLAKQFLLQTGNPYNETRIYNPTSPIVAAGMTLALGAVRPTRFIDLYGGLGGIAQSLLGGIGSLIPGGNAIIPPPGTVAGALPDVHVNSDGKGLLRAGTAAKGLSNLQAAWPPTQGNTSTFGSIIKGLVTSLFQNFIPQTQSGIKARSDEGAYGLMIGAGATKFASTDAGDGTLEFGQLWIGGSKTIRKNGQYPARAYRLFTKYNSSGQRIVYPNISTGGFHFSISTVGSVGYDVQESGVQSKPGYRYGDSVGEAISTPAGSEYENSDVMVQYQYYADPSQPFPTKDPEKNKVVKTNASLTKVLNAIKAASEGAYTVTPDSSAVIFQTEGTKYNYDRLFNTAQRNTNPVNYQLGSLKAYRDAGVTMVDNTIAPGVDKSYKLPTAGKFDAINTLTVLPATLDIQNPKLKSWDTLSPYDDDLVALYFYDVVNEKYIPFRAAIKGLSENGNASWEEMPFIGRADRIYSYGGFTRNLSFNLKIVISSILELSPTWQRVNYICTSYKPANYTKASLTLGNVTAVNRFMIPPMFMLTIGDLYRDQPLLIQSVTLTIPDDAAWETQNDDNLKGQDWSYLAKIIKAPQVLSGQVPREVELGFAATLLEKERAIVGGANFGHAPRNEDWSQWNDESVPEGAKPNAFNRSLVVDIPKTGVLRT